MIPLLISLPFALRQLFGLQLPVVDMRPLLLTQLVAGRGFGWSDP